MNQEIFNLLISESDEDQILGVRMAAQTMSIPELAISFKKSTDWPSTNYRDCFYIYRGLRTCYRLVFDNFYFWIGPYSIVFFYSYDQEHLEFGPHQTLNYANV